MIHHRISYTAAVACFMLLASCAQHNPDADSKPSESGWALTDSLLHTLRIDTATSRPVEAQLSLTGKITPDETHMVKLYPMVSGLITSVNAQVGDLVRTGQTLATLKSPEMAGFTADQATAASDVQTAKRNLDATESFYKSGLSSEKELTAAKADYAKAQAQLQRSQSVLNINGGTHAAAYTLKAPINGFVISKSATDHMQWRADNQDPAFVIADLTKVWAIVNVFESDIANVKEGDKVNITTLSYPGKVFTGSISRVYNMLDPDNKVMKARVVIDNPGYQLKPEMFVSIQASRHADSSAVSVPAGCLIFDNDKNYVLVVTHKQPLVQVREVTVDKTADDRAYISSGLHEGEEVIASRQVFIYESLKQ